LTNEKWLKWTVARYYPSRGYKVTMKPPRAGNAMLDGVAVGPEGERIAIEVKSPRDDIIRGLGQCYEAVCAGYTRAVLVTTLRIARKLRKRVFQRRALDSSASTPKHGSTDMTRMDGGCWAELPTTLPPTLGCPNVFIRSLPLRRVNLNP